MTLTGRPTPRDPGNAIEFDRVSRQFTIYHERTESLQDWFIHRFRRGGAAGAEEFWALRDLSFNVRHGETVALVGRNGAGKSTLLKLVTGILEPTGGALRVDGRIYAMLELGAGFHPELSGRDNIYLNGAIYGLGRKAMRQRYEQIVTFAELEHFIDTPVKHYSSGMFMRLGFATAIHMDPRVLVIDEVMAVGDSAFRRKCHDAIRDLQRQGVTILLVSHDSEEVREFCQRVVLLSEGQVVADGPTEDVLTEYARLQLREQGHGALSASAPTPGADHVHAQIASVVLCDAAGQPTQVTTAGASLTAKLVILGDTAAPLNLLLRWRTPLGVLLHEGWHALTPVAAAGPRRVCCHFPEFPLQGGAVLLEAVLWDAAKGVIIDTAEVRLEVDGPPGALFQFQHAWEEPEAAAVATPAQPALVATGKAK